MVFLTRALLRIKPDELGKHLKRPFIDKLRVFVKSGGGGHGYEAIGGIGGDGGDVIVEANSKLSLGKVYEKNLKKRYIATCGENSRRLKPFGERGTDVVIQVPVGIQVVTDSGALIGEVNEDKERILVARGGRGGSAHNKYQKSPGVSFSVNLDLKLIADVGLIGFPNAGKSTLLSLVSRAKPKIANYAFTTLNPQLGMIEYDDNRTITVADLPGLVEGAHFNRGMGHKFLKHITRTKINMFVIDVNGFQLSEKFEKRNAFETVVFLNKELEMYDETLLDKPSVLVINKLDMPDAAEKYEQFQNLFNNYDESLSTIDDFWKPKRRIKFESIHKISAKNNENVDKLCLDLREIIDKRFDLQQIEYDQIKANEINN